MTNGGQVVLMGVVFAFYFSASLIAFDFQKWFGLAVLLIQSVALVAVALFYFNIGL